MVFQVLNCRKIKDDLHLKNVLKHNSRESVTGSEEWLNPDWVPDGLHDVSQTYAEAWAAREEALKGLTRKPQKNAAAAMEIFVSAGEGFSGDWKSYFQDALEFLAQKFGKENLIASAVHTDETTPHLHAIFVPVINTAKGRTYSSANFFGGRKGLARLQTEFARFVGNKHGLERGIEGSRASHKSLKQYKREMALFAKKNKAIGLFMTDLQNVSERPFAALQRLRTAKSMTAAERIKLADEVAKILPAITAAASVARTSKLKGAELIHEALADIAAMVRRAEDEEEAAARRKERRRGGVGGQSHAGRR